MSKLSLSIISHGQAALIAPLLDDLRRLALPEVEVIITINIPEDEGPIQNVPIPFRVIRNTAPKGFGENHNFAFTQSTGCYFIVVNPDIRLPDLDLDRLLGPMSDNKVGAVSPLVLHSMGGIEDSVRRFPTIVDLTRRILFGQGAPGYKFDATPIIVDWAAGMFVVFRRKSYEDVGGFDHNRFFMYFEDVDICKRLKEIGWLIVMNPQVTVIHDAQRASHRSLKHMRWHLTSAFRYLTGL